MITQDNAKGDFSKGSILGNMIRLALPIIIAEFVQVTYNIVDRMYLGHIPGCGTEALTGVGLVFPFITLITAFSNLCSYGGGTLSAIARGEKDDEKARRIMENALTLLIITGLILIAFFYLFTDSLLLKFGADENTAVYASEYFDIYIIGTVFVLISLGMNCFINMQGFPIVGMCTVLIGAISNLILDPIFIFTLEMGIKGAAIATVISQFLSATWVIIFLLGKKANVRIRQLRLNRTITSDLFKLGAGGFCFKATNSLTQIVVNTTLAAFGGEYTTILIASISIINSVREVVYLPVQGFNEGAKPVMSYNYGAKEYSRVDKSISILLWFSVLFNILIWAVMIIFPGFFVRIFTSDQALIKMCVPCLRIYFCMFFMMAFQSAGQNVFVALKHPGYTIFFSLLRKVGLIVPLTLLLPRLGMGYMGVFWAEVLSELLCGASCFITMYLKVWRPIKSLADPME